VRRDASSPEAYRTDVRSDGAPALVELFEAVRRTVLDEAPDVVEGIRYGMLDYPGVASLAAQKDYVALYVAPAVLDRHRDQFPGVGVGKSCLRFAKAEQLDRVALRRLLRDLRRHRAATDDPIRP
jgi:hypothetical protein